MSLVDDIAQARTEQDGTAVVYLDGRTWSQAEALKADVVELRRQQALRGTDLAGPATQLAEMEATLEELLAKVEASKCVWSFRALSQDDHRELLEKYQPTEDGLLFNQATYPPALVAEACIGVTGPNFEHKTVTLAEAQGVWKTLNERQCDELFGAAWRMQQEAPRPFTFAATDPRASSVLSSTLASVIGESLTPGS